MNGHTGRHTTSIRRRDGHTTGVRQASGRQTGRHTGRHTGSVAPPISSSGRSSTTSLVRRPPPPPIQPQGDPPPPATLRLALAAVVLLGMVAVAQKVILPERLRNREIEARLEKLREDNRALGSENKRLAREVRALQDDPVYVEHVLRRSMRYVRPEEVRPPEKPADGAEASRSH